MNELFQASDVIHTHTRAQLIEDGDLIDVSETAREAGFYGARRHHPRGLGRLRRSGRPTYKAQGHDSGRSRPPLGRDLYGPDSPPACVAINPAACSSCTACRCRAEASVSSPRGAGDAHRSGDAGEPVITIGLPNEDQYPQVPDEGTATR